MKHIRLLSAMVAMMLVAPAHAGPSGTIHELPTIEVSYSDINLATTQGAEVMLRRIVFAAKRVCGDRSGIREITERQEVRVCVRVASATALEKIKAPQLAALLDGSAGKSLDEALDRFR
jgi:UrcA family protein